MVAIIPIRPVLLPTQPGIRVISRIVYTLKFTIAVVPIWLLGCANLPYYTQAVDGHMEILRKSQPIKELIADPNTDQKLKQILRKVIVLREFASSELKLPNNPSYTSYADLQRPYAVWNVFASPELSTEPKTWCFIQAGCVSYRGFFSQDQAKHFAEKLKNEGYDVYIGGIRAYSTLGWFNDPVLNTFINYSEMELARLIFHELSHQVVYVEDDSVFNESFATTVEHEGVRRWFESNSSVSEQLAFNVKLETETIFTQLVLKHRKRLKTLFISDTSDTEKRTKKTLIFNDLREEFAQLKTTKPALKNYDRWFAQEPNNARLATVSIYTQLLPAFQTLLAQQDRDMAQFFEAVKKISRLPHAERRLALQTLQAEGNQLLITENE